jgi:uncharacterized RDD family membrane protein YckC
VIRLHSDLHRWVVHVALVVVALVAVGQAWGLPDSKDRLLAASALVAESSGRPDASGERLWVVVDRWASSGGVAPSETGSFARSNNRGKARVALLHSAPEGPGLLNIVAEHATMPEALAAFGDRAWLVFRSTEFGRREVIMRRGAWNHATNRSFSFPPEGELLPSLPLEGDLVGCAADERGVFALLALPAPKVIRTDAQSVAEKPIVGVPPRPVVLHLTRSGWTAVDDPDSRNWAGAIGLVDGPRGVRVLLRTGEIVRAVDPFAVGQSRPLLAIEIPSSGVDGRSRWFQSVRALVDGDATSPTPVEVLGFAKWPVPRRTAEPASNAASAAATPNLPASFRAPLSIAWQVAAPPEGPTAITEQVRIDGQEPGQAARDWTIVRAVDGLIVLTLAAERAPASGLEGKSESEQKDDAQPTSASRPEKSPAALEERSLESRVVWARINFAPLTKGAAQPRTVSPAALLRPFQATGLGVEAWIHIPLIVMVGMAALMIVAFVRIIRSPEPIQQPLDLPVLPIWRRVGALLLDVSAPVAVAAVLFDEVPTPIVLLTSWPTSLNQANAALTAIGLIALHTGVSEWLTGTSIGKRVFGAAVIGTDGRDLRFGQAFMRSSFKALILAAPILAVFTLLQRERRGIGEIASGTMVIDRKRWLGRSEAAETDESRSRSGTE